MNAKQLFRSISLTAVFMLSVSALQAMPAAKYDPTGLWEYSAPDVTEGYQAGVFEITEAEDGYGVAFILSPEYKLEASNVKMEKKTLSFSLYVEGTYVEIKGTFKRDDFTGTVTYTDGSFDFTAVRKKVAEESSE